mgnify:CR=1 FL=1
MDIDKVYNLFFKSNRYNKIRITVFSSEQISPNYKKYKFNIKKYKCR